MRLAQINLIGKSLVCLLIYIYVYLYQSLKCVDSFDFSSSFFFLGSNLLLKHIGFFFWFSSLYILDALVKFQQFIGWWGRFISEYCRFFFFEDSFPCQEVVLLLIRVTMITYASFWFCTVCIVLSVGRSRKDAGRLLIEFDDMKVDVGNHW